MMTGMDDVIVRDVLPIIITLILGFTGTVIATWATGRRIRRRLESICRQLDQIALRASGMNDRSR